jgi:uncharacterized protein YjbI with pentapeptide repeats
MANKEQLAILKQGVEVWNEWRQKDKSIVPWKEYKTKVDLMEADLNEDDLTKANLREADLTKANLVRAILSHADLAGAILFNAKLGGADLSHAHFLVADLSHADLSHARLSHADLDHADLNNADLRYADLSDTILRGADLRYADLRGADLQEANLIQIHVGGTDFPDLDLRYAKGLETIVHDGPSIIGTDTLTRSAGSIPDVFLRGAGLSDWEIESAKLYNPDLTNDQVAQIQYRVYELRATQALQISPLFISYSHGDSEFVDRIGDCFNKKSIRYWRDIHDMKAGRLEKQIDTAIRQNPTVLLILSKNSLNSDWVEHEARTARALEKDLGRDVLCPIALDSTWNSKDNRWPRHVMEQIMEYNILDFSTWQDDSTFDRTFRKLIDGLELFYKK